MGQLEYAANGGRTGKGINLILQAFHKCMEFCDCLLVQ